MNNYIPVIPESLVNALVALCPGVQFLPIGCVTHAEDPEQKKYLINMEIKPDVEQNG